MAGIAIVAALIGLGAGLKYRSAEVAGVMFAGALLTVVFLIGTVGLLNDLL